MVKKGMAVCIALVLLLALLPLASYAMTGTEQAQRIVQEANEKIAKEVYSAQCTPKDDTQQLVQKTDQIARKAIADASKIGVAVICEYTYYWVDGHYVKIDPLKVAY